MKFSKQAITRSIATKVLKAKHNSPHIFFGLGVVGVGVGTYLACKSTLKLEETVDKVQEDINRVKALNPKDSNRTLFAPDAPDYNKQLIGVYIRGAATIGRLYAPAIVVTGLSVASLTGAHVQLTRRNTALAATLASTTKMLDEYRARVREEMGDDKELDLWRGILDEEIDEDGEKKTVKVRGQEPLSQYARLFDAANVNHQKFPELNKMFLNHQQSYANQILQAKGHIFLNEIYDALGFERTPQGQIVGWLLNGDGDNYVDFGIHKVRNADFNNGHEYSIWLDFNVDGPIFSEI